MKKYLCLLSTLTSVSLLTAQAEWRISGEAVPGGSSVLLQNPANAAEFVYKGRLSDSTFKITDGANDYVPLCDEESDPLGDTVDCRMSADLSETGFRIRYADGNDYFRVTLNTGETLTLSAEEITPPAALYLIGGPLNTHDPNWLLGDAKELEKDAENPFIFRYKGYLAYNTFGDERGNFKLLQGLAWDPAYHPDGTANALLSASLKTPTKMRLGGADTKWEIPSDGSANGYYEISINTLDETICVDSFLHSDVAYPAKIYITGDAMPCGWVNNTSAEVMMPVAGQYGVYSWTGTTATGEFKFLKATDTWGRCYVATTEGEAVVLGQPHSIVYVGNDAPGNDYKFIIPTAGEYTIRVDLRSMTMTVAQPVPVTGVELSVRDTIIAENGAVSLTATVQPANADNQVVSWASGNSSVASISGAGATVTLTGVAAGSAFVVVTTDDGGFTDTCRVEVRQPAVAPQTYTVTFTVSSNGAAVGDAVVTFNGVTNAAGSYVFADIADGTYAYTVAKSGYEAATDSLTVSGEDVTHSVALTATPTSILDAKNAAATATLYPNPVNAAQRIGITLPDGVGGSVAVRIYDLSGTLVGEQRMVNASVTAPANAGMYILLLELPNGQTAAQRIVVK
ncbi:MAG: SusF/SusE family outer membrane protein [Prevotellaceae bacterium]|nr:SusF/SusE family outer membrane protein [Prevotellaceae bacterium]